MLQTNDHDLLVILSITLSAVVVGYWSIVRTAKNRGRSVAHTALAHRQHMYEARQLLRALRAQGQTGTQTNTARHLINISPEVFEELLFCCFEERGFTVKHSDRYARDGRIDGAIAISGKEYLVKVACDCQHINAHELKLFSTRIKQRNVSGGYLCHTGCTGESLGASGNVKIISGGQLWALIEGTLPAMPEFVA